MKTMCWMKVRLAAIAAAVVVAGGCGLRRLPAQEPEAKSALERDPTQVRDLTPVTIHKTPQHPPVIIVRDGVPQAKVYVADGHPGKNLAILVKELVEAVKLSTGAELEVVKQLPADDVPTIVIGDCDASRAAGIDAAKIPIEGFVVRTASNRIYLVGSAAPLPTLANISGPYSNDGTAWAVADFLERFAGVRWYWPTEVNGRSIVKTRTLVVGPTDYSDEPVFHKRECWPWTRYSKKTGEWRARFFEKNDPVPSERAIPAGLDAIDMTAVLAGLRMGNSWPYQVKVHDPQQIWKNQKLIDQHPDMFSKKKDGKPNFSMLCYSSQKTFDFLIAGCEAVWEKGQFNLPGWQNHGVSWVTSTSVTISPFDQPLDCACEACQSLLRDGGPSKHMARFVKKFAEEVKRRWPGKMVLYLPYWNYAKCPEDVEFPDNVQIQLCTTPFATMKEPKVREGIEKNLAAWRKKSPDRVQTWEYSNGVTGWTFAPVQYPHLVKDYYARNRDLIVGSFINGEFLNEWSKTAPTLYCWMKVLWNPDVDVDAIMDVFCERMFGKASKTARELLQLMCDRWENTPFSAFRNTGRPDSGGFAKTWPPETVERMAGLWGQARKELQDDPVALQRFEYFTWTFEHFLKEAQEASANTQKK
ncbi:MAG: DUF4838 domain-containing protein [Planctomycetota bacterium]|nr:DUF4838 domain-containing protein [Planctomycetota bacterium]